MIMYFTTDCGNVILARTPQSRKPIYNLTILLAHNQIVKHSRLQNNIKKIVSNVHRQATKRTITFVSSANIPPNVGMLVIATRNFQENILAAEQLHTFYAAT